MTVIIIGDVAVEGTYHLGDEAMTEQAIDALRARGASSLTVVSGTPAVAEKRFGVQAIPRLNYRDLSARERTARLVA